jgi:hypothetical protein
MKAYPKVKYKIDVLKVFDFAYGGSDPKLRAKLRGTLGNAIFMQKFGEEIIERIVKRTLKGIDKNSIEFPEYSKSYLESYVFELYKKNPARVNLRLSGQMLSSMKVSRGSYEVTIWIPDDFNNAKAHGHIFGKKKRDFLGLPRQDEADAMRTVFKRLGSGTIENLIDFEKTDVGSTTFKSETVTPLGTVTTEQAIEQTFTPSITLVDGKLVKPDGNEN